MENKKKYSTELADIIMENFTVAQMKRYVYFDKIPKLIFYFEKNENELSNYEKLNELIRNFKGNLEWGLFKCSRSKINYMISPMKWNEIERGIDFKNEQCISNDNEYLELLKLATMDYELLVNYLKTNL